MASGRGNRKPVDRPTNAITAPIRTRSLLVIGALAGTSTSSVPPGRSTRASSRRQPSVSLTTIRDIEATAMSAAARAKGSAAASPCTIGPRPRATPRVSSARLPSSPIQRSQRPRVGALPQPTSTTSPEQSGAASSSHW